MKRRAACALLLVAACAAPERPPALEREQHRSAAAAHTAFADGNLGRARALYVHALGAARLDDDALALGNLTYDLAMVVAEQGDQAQALALLAEAEAALQRAGQPTHDVALLRARLRWRSGDAAGAQRELAALAGSGPLPPAVVAESALLRGQLACGAGDAAAARLALTELAHALGDDPAHPGRLGTTTLAAEIATLDGDPRAAAELQDRVALALQEAREFRRMAEALARAGEAYEAAHDPGHAADRFVRAAHSRTSARQVERARQLLQRARACADSAGDERLQARVRALALELGEDAARPPAPAAVPDDAPARSR